MELVEDYCKKSGDNYGNKYWSRVRILINGVGYFFEEGGFRYVFYSICLVGYWKYNGYYKYYD